MTVPPCMPDAIWRSSPGSDASRTETQRRGAGGGTLEFGAPSDGQH